MMDNEHKTRIRRTNDELDADITNAISDAIKHKGFSGLTFRDIMERGNVSPLVLNHRYESIDDLIDQYVKKFDYWLNHTVDIDPLNIDDPKEYYIEAAERLISSFYRNKELQQLHIWEMLEDNLTTRRTAKMRETETARLIGFFEDKFKDSEIDIAAVTAIIVGGIYDVILRKDRSTFCGIDFSTRIGKKRLNDAANTIILLLYEQQEKLEMVIRIAVKLLKSGVSVEAISHATGLSMETIEAIAPDALK